MEHFIEIIKQTQLLQEEKIEKKNLGGALKFQLYHY